MKEQTAIPAQTPASQTATVKTAPLPPLKENPGFTGAIKGTVSILTPEGEKLFRRGDERDLRLAMNYRQFLELQNLGVLFGDWLYSDAEKAQAEEMAIAEMRAAEKARLKG